MNEIFLIRHGENVANLTKEFSHRKVDYSLTAKGVLQAGQTAEELLRRAPRVDAVYTSPLKRARETGEVIAAAYALAPVVVEEFREVNVGDLEGAPVTQEIWDRHDQIIDAWRNGHPEVAFPGGENYFSLFKRFRSGLEQIIGDRDGRRMVVVGHGGQFSFCIRGLVNNASIEGMLSGDNHNCSISRILARNSGGRLTFELVEWASSLHLKGEAARLVTGWPKPGELR